MTDEEERRLFFIGLLLIQMETKPIETKAVFRPGQSSCLGCDQLEIQWLYCTKHVMMRGVRVRQYGPEANIHRTRSCTTWHSYKDNKKETLSVGQDLKHTTEMYFVP